MTEIGIGGASIVAAGWAGKKLVGPLFDEIAEDWRNRYSEHRKKNAVRIGEKAQEKLGDRIDDAGSVPPRVALRIMEEGSWCDAEVMSEYFGGILAASRSAEGVDDRGAVWAGLVSRLSTYDVYLHYLAYDAFVRIYRDRGGLNLGINTERTDSMVYLPAAQTLLAMNQHPTAENWLTLVTPSVTSLIREGLIDDVHSYGDPEFLKKHHQIHVPDTGLTFTPSVPGIELFMWAHGYQQSGPNAILEGDRTFKAVDDLGSVSGAAEVAVLRTEATERAVHEQSGHAVPGDHENPTP